MEMIGPLGIVIAIIFIILMAMKGYNILYIAPIASIIVILTNQMDFFSSLIGKENSYMTGLTGFVVNFFAVFLLGSILAKYMEQSGAAQSIAQKVLSYTGTEKPFSVLVAIFLISSILTFGGISLFVVLFVIIPLARPLFKELNIAWNLIVIPVYIGIGTFTMTMLPGTPSIQNVVPIPYLGTTLTAAPLLGIIGSVVAVTFGLWYMRYTLNKSLANGETYAQFNADDQSTSELKEKTPSFIMSILPILLLMVVNLTGSALEIPNTILIGLGLAVIACAICYHKYIPSQKVVLNEGGQSSINPIFLTSSAVAFGIVVTTAPGFKFISDLILGIPGDPLVSLSVAASALSGITGSSSGALGIVMEVFAKTYLAMGVSPEAMHRVGAIASSALTIMPHTGVVLSLLALTGLTHKNSFKYQFISMTFANIFALIAVIIAAILIY